MTENNTKDELLEQLLSPECSTVEQDFINSSSIKSAKYDKISKTLTVRFKTSLDVAYIYYDVSAETVKALFEAKSAGSFFATTFKKSGLYSFIKIPEKKKEAKK